MPLEVVFLLLGFGVLSATLVGAVCSVLYPEARRSFREWVNTAISIVTLFVLAWTARSIVDQVTEMRKVYPEIHGQLDEMQLDARPWLRIRVVGVDNFVVTENRIQFGLVVQFVNSGKSPAFDVERDAAFFVVDYPRLLIHQDDQCKFAERISREGQEKKYSGLRRTYTIFPGEDTSPREGWYIDRSEVHSYDVKTTNTGEVMWVAPVFIGCVAYRQMGVETYRHTSFAIEIGKRDASGNFVRIQPGVQTTEATDVRVRFSVFGDNTAD
jgi:hypothetical protein